MSTKRTTSSRGRRPAGHAAAGAGAGGRRRGLRSWVPTILAGVGLVAVVSVYAVMSDAGGGGGIAQAPGTRSLPAGETPAPWEYDEENDRHWHAGHGHWHSGPPPGEGEREESASPGPEAP